MKKFVWSLDEETSENFEMLRKKSFPFHDEREGNVLLMQKALCVLSQLEELGAHENDVVVLTPTESRKSDGEKVDLGFWEEGFSRTFRTLYRPESREEGEVFEREWCDHCVRSRERYPIPCPLQKRAKAHDVDHPDYPWEWMFDRRGRAICSAFKKR